MTRGGGGVKISDFRSDVIFEWPLRNEIQEVSHTGSAGGFTRDAEVCMSRGESATKALTGI